MGRVGLLQDRLTPPSEAHFLCHDKTAGKGQFAEEADLTEDAAERVTLANVFAGRRGMF